jgi:hypothetical protein
VRADFQGTAECFRVAIQAALTTKPPTTSSVPANEAQAVMLCGRLRRRKGSTLGLLMNARLPSSAPAWTTNRKARSSSSCKITETTGRAQTEGLSPSKAEPIKAVSFHA